MVEIIKRLEDLPHDVKLESIYPDAIEVAMDEINIDMVIMSNVPKGTDYVIIGKQSSKYARKHPDRLVIPYVALTIKK